jgi:predicted O-methyltransferase YrrM
MFRADTHRRRLSLARPSGWKILTIFDVSAVTIAIALAATLVGRSSALFSAAFALFAVAFLWTEGKRQVQLQRPAGIVFAESCLLLGIYGIFTMRNSGESCLKLAPVIVGAMLLGLLVPAFLKGHEEHRILRQLSMQGEFVQQECVNPTPECPFPDQWKMFDAQSAELEVLDFLKALVITIKPSLILETGTFIGHSSIRMAEGLRQNGFGKLVTVEYDPAVYARACSNIQTSGLAGWIDAHCASSLEIDPPETIDLLYSDSDLKIRESEVRRFLPQIKTGGLILIHDASSSFQLVREAALQMEREGLLSVLLLPTPRGLVMAQKLEGRR